MPMRIKRRFAMPLGTAILCAALTMIIALATGGGKQALAQDPMPLEASEFADLDRVMSLSVNAASPSVVRVLIPEYSREQQQIIAERKRLQRVDQLQAEQLKREAQRRLEDAAESNPRLRQLQEQLKGMTEKLAELEGPEFSRQLTRLRQLLKEIEAAKPADEHQTPPADADAEADADADADADQPPANDSAEAPAEADADESAAADDGLPIVPVRQHPRTGVIISADGYVITSLVGCGRQRDGLQVQLSDGRTLDATALGEDLRRDVLLLKIDADDLPAVKIVPRDELRLGQWVLAIGRTLPIGGTTVNKGIISSLNRHAGLALQTDANISPVNFGGLLADIRGRGIAMIASVDVAGSSVSASRYSDSGIGFAVPLQDIMVHMETLKAGKRIEPPFLGVQFNMARLSSGAEIQEVIPNSAAAASGIKSGDIVVELDGRTIESCYQLLHEIGSRSVGDTISLTVIRGELPVELTATLRPRPTRFRG